MIFGVFANESRSSPGWKFLLIWIVAFVVFLAALPVMSRLTGLPSDATIWNSDHPAHLRAAAMLAGDWRDCLPHPLYHATLVMMSAGNVVAMPGVAATLLSLMIAFKFYLTLRVLSVDDGVLAVGTRRAQWWPTVTVALLLTLAMPLPNWWKYGILLGQPSPNVWHNPTTIFCMPIVLGLFPTAIRSTNSLRLSDSIVTGMLFFLCTLAKPNYPLAFAPCCALMLMSQLQIHRGIDLKRWCRILGCGIAMFTPLLLLLGLQFAFAFGSSKPESAGIEIAPFKVWSLFTPNFTASTILGLMFPLAVAIAYPRRIRGDACLAWAWVTLTIAMLQLILLAETGPRWMHGNFVWGMLFSTTIVYVYSARILLMAPRDFRQITCAALLCLHAGSGVWCLVRTLMDPANVTLF